MSRRVRSMATLGPAVVALLLFASSASAQFDMGLGLGRNRPGGGFGVGVQAGSACTPRGCPSPSGGRPQQGADLFPPNEGAAPPAETAGKLAEAKVKRWLTTVRLRRPNGNGYANCGSGTIIHGEPGNGYILTCAHEFEGGLNRNVLVDVFGAESDASPVRPVVTYAGTMVRADRARDVAIIRFNGRRRLPHRPLVAQDWKPGVAEVLVATGYPGDGAYKAEPTRYVQPVRFQEGYVGMECSRPTIEGQSGGGLLTADGYLAGVCNFRDARRGTGLFALVTDGGYRILDECKLTTLVMGESPSSGPVDDRPPASNLGSDSLIADFGAASIGETPAATAPAIVAMNPPKRTHAPRPTPEPAKPVAPLVVATPEPAVEPEKNDLVLVGGPLATAVVVSTAAEPTAAPEMVEIGPDPQQGGKSRNLTWDEYQKSLADAATKAVEKHLKDNPQTVVKALEADVKAAENTVKATEDAIGDWLKKYGLWAGAAGGLAFAFRKKLAHWTAYLLSDELILEMLRERLERKSKKSPAIDLAKLAEALKPAAAASPTAPN
jgi:hypothetical protein